MDVSGEWAKQENHFFIPLSVQGFDPRSASGRIRWGRRSLKQRVSHHEITPQVEDYAIWEDVPPGEYEEYQDLPFSISFVSPRTVRVKVAARSLTADEEPSLMLQGEPGTDGSWETSDDGEAATYWSGFGSVTVRREP